MCKEHYENVGIGADYVEMLIRCLDCDEVVEVLEKEGVQKVVDPYNELIEEIEQKSNRLARQAL